MEILEYGNRENKKIILIHGFESPYQIWDEYIKYYEKDYHIIVPILPGHNPKQKEEFNSFEDIINEFEEYYISRYGTNVYAIYGMSIGGILASKLWENKKLNFKNVILESSPLMSSNKFITKILIYSYLILTHKTQKRDKKTINKAINSIITKDKLDYLLELIDNISDKTIENYLKEIGKYKLSNNIDTPNTKIYYYHGTKINEMLAKKTAKYISKNYINSKVICFKGKGHCEDSLLNPNKMIEELNKILK